MNDPLIGIIGVGVIIILLILVAVSSQQEPQNERQVVDRGKQRRAIENYKKARRRYFQRLQRQRQAYMRAVKTQQKKGVWRRRRQRFISHTKQAIHDTFPEMADPRLRSQAIKNLIVQAANHILTGGRLSADWRRKIRDDVSDTDGYYETKRQLNEWRLAKIEEINNQFQDGKIDEEQRKSCIEYINDVYEEVEQTLSFRSES